VAEAPDEVLSTGMLEMEVLQVLDVDKRMPKEWNLLLS